MSMRFRSFLIATALLACKQNPPPAAQAGSSQPASKSAKGQTTKSVTPNGSVGALRLTSPVVSGPQMIAIITNDFISLSYLTVLMNQPLMTQFKSKANCAIDVPKTPDGKSPTTVYQGSTYYIAGKLSNCSFCPGATPITVLAAADAKSAVYSQAKAFTDAVVLPGQMNNLTNAYADITKKLADACRAASLSLTDEVCRDGSTPDENGLCADGSMPVPGGQQIDPANYITVENGGEPTTDGSAGQVVSGGVQGPGGAAISNSITPALRAMADNPPAAAGAAGGAAGGGGDAAANGQCGIFCPDSSCSDKDPGASCGLLGKCTCKSKTSCD